MHRASGVMCHVAGSMGPRVTLFATPPPAVADDDAERIVATHYGVFGKATRLHSERDANFLIESSRGRFVLKISNGAEPPERLEVNTSALLHLAHDAPGLPVPRLISTIDGQHYCFDSEAGATGVIRLFTFLEGRPLSALPKSRRPLEAIGRCIGGLDASLQSFSHRHMRFSLLWDSTNVDSLRELSRCIESRSDRDFVLHEIDRFVAEVKPGLDTLRHQVIHNDANLGNVLISHGDDSRVTGLFDFGDLVYAPVVNELAVAASYHVDGDGMAMQSIARLAAGYCESYPLLDNELGVLNDLVMARLLTTVLVTSWRATLFPENEAYIVRNRGRALAGLAELSGQHRNADGSWSDWRTARVD